MRASRSGYAPAARPSDGHPAATSNDAAAPPAQADRTRATAATSTSRPRGRLERGSRRLRVTPEAYRRWPAGASRHLVRASQGWCVGAPDHRAWRFGTRVPLPCGVPSPSMATKPTRDRTGDSTWGVGHGTGNGRSPRGGSREGSRAPLTSRVTGSFGHRARKTAGLAALIDTAEPSSGDRPPGYPGGDHRVRVGAVPTPISTRVRVSDAPAAGCRAGRDPPGRRARPRRAPGRA